MAGSIRVAGHTIAQHDIVNDKVDIQNATLGSSVTFPAGHVLQVQQFEITQTTSLTTTYTNFWELSLTLKSNSSDVYIWFNFQYKLDANGGFGIKIFRNSSATVTSSHTSVWSKNVVAGGNPFTWYQTSARWDTGSLLAKDSISGFASGDTIYYGFFGRKYDSNAATIGADTTEDGWQSAILMEVQK